jgi:hypothetical protein
LSANWDGYVGGSGTANAFSNLGHKRLQEIDAAVISMKQEFLHGKNQKQRSASLGVQSVKIGMR